MFDFEGLRDKSDDRRRLLREYLAVWSELVPAADVEEAARLAWAISPLYHAVSYARIVMNIEPADRLMFAGEVQRFLLLYLDRIERANGGTHGWDSTA